MTPKLTNRQAAIISAYTGILAGPFTDFHEYAEEVLGRPVFVHEFAFIDKELKEAARGDFMSLIPNMDT
jgi:hypothetical protein